MLTFNNEVRKVLIQAVLDALKSDGYSASKLEKTRELLSHDDEFLGQMFNMYCMEEK